MSKPFSTALAFSMLPFAALASEWQTDPEQSAIEFRFYQGSTATPARFDSFSAQIRFDPENLDDADIAATIDIGSFNSGNSQVDGAVAGQDWFATSSFPQATFQSTTVTASADGVYNVEGTLTIRDNTVPITLAGPIAIDGNRAEATMTVTLIRTEFGVGQGSFASGDQVGLEVPVTVRIIAER